MHGHTGPCTLGSLVPWLLGQCPLGRPTLCTLRHTNIPALACYLLAPLRCFPSSHTIDFPCGPLSRHFCHYIAGCFRLAFSLQQLAHVGSSLADFSTLTMEAIRSSETSVHTKTIRNHFSENGLLH
jgi:hypothetical protein